MELQQLEDRRDPLRLLFINPGPLPPAREPRRNKHFFLSAIAEGDVLSAVWWSGPTQMENKLGVERGEKFRIANFTHHFFYERRFPLILRRGGEFFFLLRTGLRLARRNRYDAVVTYGSNLPGVVGVLISAVTGAKLIIEIPGVPQKAFILDKGRPGYSCRIKKFVADILLNSCLAFADHVKLLYPAQLEGYRANNRVPANIFHEFVPIHSLGNAAAECERTILFLGFPWHLKGVDVLIRAFRESAAEQLGYRLRIVGHCTDRTPFVKLAQGSTAVEFERGLPYEEAMELMRKCSMVVLPSRSEAMGRVLLEAMALRKPIIASRVDGIPHYITHEENGLLFESEDAADLARQIRRLLDDEALARRLAESGYRRVRERYSEADYVAASRRLLDAALSPAVPSSKETIRDRFRLFVGRERVPAAVHIDNNSGQE